jgi:hypothetical protein
MATDHPHHVLYQIFALVNGGRLHHSTRNQDGFEMNEGRADAAGDLLNELRASPKKYVQTVVEATEALITGYIELGSQQLYVGFHFAPLFIPAWHI